MTDLALFVGGLAVLVIAGDRLVDSASRLASRAGISAMAAGVVIVGLGTSLPELVTSVDANLQGYPGAAIGNVVGSNIANLLLVLGLSVLWLPAAVNANSASRDGAWLMGASLVGVALMQFEVIGRLTGAALLAGLAVYIYSSLRHGRTRAAPDAPPPGPHERRTTTTADVTLLIAGIAGLTLGAHVMVLGAIGLANTFGVSQSLTGILLLALGTSLPELTVTIVALARRNGDLALGNVVGSTLFNLLGILGVSAITKPMPIPADMADLHIWIMALSAFAVVLFMRTGWRLSRLEGGVLLCGYPAYVSFALA